ncbi:hypothetical protein [Variovorax sp. J22R115]|uniref:hypothetical protein n=1 Tax=Variovorax sp. J22R115 TaxID=3053509 RepID=UPI002575937E|nr:hypothetical protein [Variovorax sp. J22R115]MDM0048860.1 hypothetical protein [Variovorax sp. J22R115]
MSNAAIAMNDDVPVTHTGLGWKFIHWGLGLFVTGFITGFIPIAHYMHGALAGDVGPVFLKNMTLWWGCPAILAELTLKTGGLGMAVIGLCYLAASRQGSATEISKHERIAPALCSYGLIAELVAAGAGYAIFNYFWPNFFFEPVQAGKNTWLALQGISIAIFVIGLFYAVAGVRRASVQTR